MNRGSDAMAGLMFALIGIGILIAWRSGLLKRALGLSLPSVSATPSVTQAITRIGAADVATKLPTASLAPVSLSPQTSGSKVATAGTVDDGVSSVWVGSASYAPSIDWGAYRDESMRLRFGAVASIASSPANAPAVAVVSGGGGGGLLRAM